MKRILALATAALAIAACSPRTVLIGISSGRSAAGTVTLSKNYTEAVVRAGGAAVVLPTVRTREEADAVVRRMDGIIFSGGEDINPAWYGEDILNGTVEVNSARDRSDSLLARAALESGKRILGICRGEQLMNVILGGSLYQDLPTQVGEKCRHGGGNFHKVGVAEGSFLAMAMGSDSLLVNSYHHQGVKDTAPGITVAARAGDGLVEGYESGRVWAVQFHPEKMLADGEESWLKLFRAFIRACRR